MKDFTRLMYVVALGVPLLTLPVLAQDEPTTAVDPGSQHILINAAEVKWGEASPALPRGARLAVLQGDPNVGAFTARLQAPAGYKIPLHTHPSDEMMTVISGNVDFRTGGPTSAPESLGPGGYAMMPAGMQHSASVTSDVVLQISSPGPFVINYVDPKDDPRGAR